MKEKVKILLGYPPPLVINLQMLKERIGSWFIRINSREKVSYVIFATSYILHLKVEIIHSHQKPYVVYASCQERVLSFSSFSTFQGAQS